MKIYLRFGKEWKLVNSDNKNFKNLLKERNIKIGDNSKIGDYTKISRHVEIGHFVKIGSNVAIGIGTNIGDSTVIDDYAEIGYAVRIANCVTIGNNVKTGCSVKIGSFVVISNYTVIDSYTKIANYVGIGYSSKIGYGVKIDNYAVICDFVIIGNYSKIGDNALIHAHANIGSYVEIPNGFKDIFSPLNIQIMTGVIMQNGVGMFYKAVTPELRDFESEQYQYKIGKGDSCRVKRNQQIKYGKGTYWTGYERAIELAKGVPHKIISATIKIDDILAVYNEVRVKNFNNVQEIKMTEGRINNEVQ